MKYYFGKHDTWTVEAGSLKVAIRKFRVGALFPHKYSDKRIAEEHLDEDGYTRSVYRRSEPDAMIPIYSNRELVGSIPPEDPNVEYDPSIIPRLPTMQAPSGSTALVHAPNQTPVPVKRKLIEDQQLELQRKMGELEKQKRELRIQVAAMREELKKRMEQVWMIELFLGSKEEVVMLRDGEPAPADTKIAVHQRVLCMDEEIAADRLLTDPANFEEFNFDYLEDFDKWLLEDPAHLDAILPESKGIVALRVRRYTQREDFQHDENYIWKMFVKLQRDELDSKVYLLVRNGERLYRLWVDVNCWPRFFPRLNEWDWIGTRSFSIDSDIKDAEQKAKQYFAGILVVQGLVERSDLFHPLPSTGKPDIFNPETVETYFDCIRDDEGRVALSDGDPMSRLTWKGYSEWLRDQLKPGMRILWAGPRYDNKNHYDTLEIRTGSNRTESRPEYNIPYILEEDATEWFHGLSFLYMPEEPHWSEVPRQKRVRFRCETYEIWPLDIVSWRVIEHLLKSRAERKHYANCFGILGKWYHHKKLEAVAEEPFINLVLSQCGIDSRQEDAHTHAERARAERLLRWWKTKTQVHRTLKTDEAKALRMLVRAMKSGKDEQDDPERLLFEKFNI